jgi:hypothetical protein
MDTERRKTADRRSLPSLPQEIDRHIDGAFNPEQREALREVWGLNARTLAEVQQIVRGQWRTLRIGLGLIAAIALAAGTLSLILLIRQGDTVTNVHANQANIAQLARTNRVLAQRALALGHQIQKQRVDACNDQNRRNQATVKRLRRFSAREPQTAERRAGLQGTIGLINALAPVRDCAAVLTPPAKPPIPPILPPPA